MVTNMTFLLCLLLAAGCNAAQVESLNGAWLLKDDSAEYSDVAAIVPGGIYSDLMNNSIIEDIYFGDNDVNYKWVARRNWTYYRTFTVTDDILTNDNVNLVLEGADTFSNIYINDAFVGSTRNMFVRYIFDVKSILKEGENSIEVRFLSPIEVAEDLAEKQALEYVVPPECPSAEYRGECHVNMLRKMQASFSWDWGPAFPSVGIWKDISIESYKESTIRYVAVDITDDETNWYAQVDVYLANNQKNSISGDLQLELETQSQPIAQTISVNQSPNEYGEVLQSTSITVPKDDVIRWWPNGYGVQQLYTLSVTLTTDGNVEDQKTTRIGFRKIELIQDKLDYGLTFYFKVNDIPIFLKGTNEIPLDILPERGQDETLIRNLLGAAKYAHMNTIRIWGGGVYESDYFYDLADEYGILIWQDFMFACAMYPTYDDYLENVLEEVRHQVNRLRSHPSVAVFSGNNENEGALRQNWYGTGDNFTVYYNDYVKLYINTIQAEFERITRNTRIFLSSSPSNGDASVSEGYVAQNPGDYAFGDVHFYNYVSNPWDSNIYPVARFSSEYGYQSLPSVTSIMTATDNEEDLNINSDFMDHRQHHPGGTAQMKDLIEFNLKLPDESSSKYSDAFIYYGQIVQALATKIETEHNRRYRSSFNSQGLGGTMGSLYWQLNDVWIAPTWSGIDFTGKWKMLQYFAADFFSPIIITGHINADRTLEIYVVSDLTIPYPGLTASIAVFNWRSLTPVSSEEIPVDLEAGQSILVKSIATDDYLVEKGCGDAETAKNNCFFHLMIKKTATDDANTDIHDLVGPENYVFPGLLKESNIQQPDFLYSVIPIEDDKNTFMITVYSTVPALFVWLDTTLQGQFSTNGFVQTNSSHSFYFYSHESTNILEVLNSITLTHLVDEKYL